MSPGRYPDRTLFIIGLWPTYTEADIVRATTGDADRIADDAR
jgi:hypothetical protein